jgi:hypothetical protein
VSALHGAVDAFRGTAARGDDATVIVVRAAPDEPAPEGL